MADLKGYIGKLFNTGSVSTPVQQTLVDLGDQTYAEKIAVGVFPRLDPTNDVVASARWNGGSFDPEIGNQDIIVLASGAGHVGTYVGSDVVNYNARGAMFFFNVTAVPTVDTVQLRVDGKDPASNSYTALFLGTATAATAFQKYLIYPGAGSGTGSQLTAAPAAIALPRIFRIQVVHSNTPNGGSFTYSVGLSLIV